MNIYNKNLNRSKFLVFITALALSTSLFAQAGTSLFTYGKVQLRASNGEISNLSRGMNINTGDSVLTGINGRAQIRMQDGAVFDLKPNTEFLIEEYLYNQNSNTVASTLNANENKGFYRLVRGGFRAISGLIGKRNKKNYRVRTPVATIGIRGTDYTANLCEQNCGPNGSGLYLSVASGGVVLANDAGSLDIDVGQTGFVSGPSSAPSGASTSSTENTESDSGSSTTEAVVPKAAVDDTGNEVSLEIGGELPVAQEIIPQGQPGQVAVSVAGITSASVPFEANLVTDDRANLTQLSTVEGTYSSGTSSPSNQGFDAKTGLYWGHWANGTASFTDAVGTSSEIALDSQSAHWIYTTNQVTPTLPLSGTANFNLVGNTNPTDNQGNSGVLGTASLSADFTNQTVDADVNLSINNQTWDASATDVALNGEAATFEGEFDTVSITDETNGGTADGSGELSGFLTGDADGNVAGAGMAYSLSDDVDTTVEGAVAFEVDSTPTE